jgi:hypothetical protein
MERRRFAKPTCPVCARRFPAWASFQLSWETANSLLGLTVGLRFGPKSVCCIVQVPRKPIRKAGTSHAEWQHTSFGRSQTTLRILIVYSYVDLPSMYKFSFEPLNGSGIEHEFRIFGGPTEPLRWCTREFHVSASWFHDHFLEHDFLGIVVFREYEGYSQVEGPHANRAGEWE